MTLEERQKGTRDMDETTILSGYADALGGDDELGAANPLLRNPTGLRAITLPRTSAAQRARGLASTVAAHVSSLASQHMSEERVEAIVKRMFDRIAAQFPPGYLPAPNPMPQTTRLTLGFGYGDSLSATNPSVTLSVQPPRSLRGARLVIDRKNNGTDAPNVPVVVTSFSVGDLKQNVGFAGIPVEAFDFRAVATALQLDQILANTTVEIGVAVADGYSLPTGDEIAVGACIIGDLYEGR